MSTGRRGRRGVPPSESHRSTPTSMIREPNLAARTDPTERQALMGEFADQDAHCRRVVAASSEYFGEAPEADEGHAPPVGVFEVLREPVARLVVAGFNPLVSGVGLGLATPVPGAASAG